MALPNPIPDNPLRWDGWRNYNSSNYYERLCLDYASNATTEVIEDNCRQLLVWWQKKLPLKNQPSNPIAQMLRQGLDEAPGYLAEARTILLDPAQREKVDASLRVGVIEKALEEFKKLLSFAISDKTLTAESEERLYAAGERLGLSHDDMLPAIDAELAAIEGKRVATPVTVAPSELAKSAAAGAAQSAGGNPFDEFRRLLQMSRLSHDGGEMTDDQRDAMCNLGESLGLTGGQAEDMIDEYLDAAEQMPMAPVKPEGAAKPAVTAKPKASTPPPAAQKAPVKQVIFTQAARMAERQKHPNFVACLDVQMQFVPSGRFTMGSNTRDAAPNEVPVFSATMSCFYMSRFPITNVQYERFDPAHKSKRATWANDLHPVVYVSWAEAEAYCKWLSKRQGKKFRLPTEAEWEYAASGGESRAFPWGDQLHAGYLANFADARTNLLWRDPSIDDGYAESSPVGTYPRGASPFGFEDMAGNVHEWCLDWIGPYPGREVANPRGAASGRQRVYRGGSWRSRASSLRTTARSSNSPEYSSNDVGFRIVCECE
jgi:formylglycine-generating enzyme required for sulfatase activity